MALPNVRKAFIPDEGRMIFDTDLSSADLRIVTWESDCKLMKDLFRKGEDPYTWIAREYYKDQGMKKSDPRRQRFKSLCHATNYLGVAKNIASNSNIGLLVHEVERIQKWYFQLCPEIKAWQTRLKAQIDRTMTVQNAFGFRFKYLGRMTNNTYNELVAWIPQSTTSLIINTAWERIDQELWPEVEILMQVHDSLVGQYPIDKPELKDKILECCQVVVPYDDPLIIPVGIKISSESWGHCA